ncbi:MAG: alcohol dehydrogenase catalytic domain-containing protein [Planctomycetaceae bacterium]|nr:alcohol dehydrogenase catalytic domain-containing protein [Planctomycetaceae bacterium]
MTTMQALVYYGPGDVRLEERPVPEPGPGEVLVKMRCVSVCGSDLGAYRLPEVSDRWKPPIVLGHEFAGDVVKNGPGAGKYAVGQRVAANPILYCGDCYYCKKGLINLCSNRNSFGTSIGGKSTDGAMQEYFAIRENAIIPLDNSLTYEQGALLEPLAVCYCAAHAGVLGNDERVVVMGAGPIGLMTVKFLKAMGASVIVSDIVKTRLDFATKYGADRTVDVSVEKLADVVMDFTGGIGVDRVIICAGNPGSIPESFGIVRNGGNIVLVALAHYHVELDPMQLVARGVSLIGSYMFTTEQNDVMRMLADAKLYVDDIVTTTIPLSQSRDVFKHLCSPSCEDVKVLLTA